MLLNIASFMQTCEEKATLFYWVGLQLHLGKERPVVSLFNHDVQYEGVLRSH
jgi:hypothetical protein